MAGTKAGGKKARDTTKQRHGQDFYSRIGGIGGAISRKRKQSKQEDLVAAGIDTETVAYALSAEKRSKR